MIDLWQPLDIADGTTAQRQFGPLMLALARTAHEWRVVPSEVPVPQVTGYVGPLALPRHFEPVRLVADASAPELRFSPALATRAIVARPETPMFVVAGSTVELYVSTPVWVQLRTASTQGVLYELPTVELADTWFGEIAGDGELCFASRTGARTTLEPVLLQPARALSVIALENRSDKHLPIERLKLPVPNLSLFRSRDGVLWTERLRFHTEATGEVMEVELGDRPPVQAGETERIAEPRAAGGRRSFARAVGALLR